MGQPCLRLRVGAWPVSRDWFEPRTSRAISGYHAPDEAPMTKLSSLYVVTLLRTVFLPGQPRQSLISPPQSGFGSVTRDLWAWFQWLVSGALLGLMPETVSLPYKGLFTPPFSGLVFGGTESLTAR